MSNIAGVNIHPLKRIYDDRGSVLHVLRSDESCFQSFGEVYCSIIKVDAVKAWKRHRKMQQNLAVPIGAIKLVIFDDRPDSSTKNMIQEIITGYDSYCLIHIPAMVWYGFRGLSSAESLIINCATLPHDAKEVDRVSIEGSTIPYVW